MIWLTPLKFAYLLGLRRAQAQARRELEDIAERFEEISEATRAELHGLRNEIARAFDRRRHRCGARRRRMARHGRLPLIGLRGRLRYPSDRRRAR